jgi:hypothetical protein
LDRPAKDVTTLLAAYPRPMTVINPQDALGIVISDREFRKEMEYVFRSDQNLLSLA